MDIAAPQTDGVKSMYGIPNKHNQMDITKWPYSTLDDRQVCICAVFWAQVLLFQMDKNMSV